MTAKKSKPTDEDMENATAALIRAAKAARKLARQTGTPIVVLRDGMLVTEIPISDEVEQEGKM
jgi:hypothetical protein